MWASEVEQNEGALLALRHNY